MQQKTQLAICFVQIESIRLRTDFSQRIKKLFSMYALLIQSHYLIIGYKVSMYKKEIYYGVKRKEAQRKAKRNSVSINWLYEAVFLFFFAGKTDVQVWK